jgi:phosphatidylserine/phosphatidylglycerophosphate/cardiolipin synthase-like enzyme
VTPKLLVEIHTIAHSFPALAIESLTQLLVARECQPWNEESKATILNQLPNPHVRRAVARLLDTWQREAKDLDNRTLAAALTAAAYSIAAMGDGLSVELVWTGPESEKIPLRRTDQVLLQLIRNAQQELTIVSFAVYKVPEIAKALVAATNRGVALHLLAETPESSDGKIPFGVKAALGAEVMRRARVLVWPKEQRPVDSEGKSGSLHAKCAIADEKHLFISSANLTEYALTLNMEMGLLVKSEDLARQVKEHINSLIEQGILVLASPIN